MKSWAKRSTRYASLKKCRATARKIPCFRNTSLVGDGFNVTIAKLVFAVALSAGFFLSGRPTAFFGRAVFPRFGGPAAAMAIEKVLFYVFMFAFILTALTRGHSPTAFAFLGSAGHRNRFRRRTFSRNLIRDSSCLHEAHQGGDGGGRQGHSTVEEVGTRSTRIKTFDNMDVIIPNSFFLQGTGSPTGRSPIRRCAPDRRGGELHGSDVHGSGRSSFWRPGSYQSAEESKTSCSSGFWRQRPGFTLYYWIDILFNAFRVASTSGTA